MGMATPPEPNSCLAFYKKVLPSQSPLEVTVWLFEIVTEKGHGGLLASSLFCFERDSHGLSHPFQKAKLLRLEKG
jgi:hypothetical protein